MSIICDTCGKDVVEVFPAPNLPEKFYAQYKVKKGSYKDRSVCASCIKILVESIK